MSEQKESTLGKILGGLIFLVVAGVLGWFAHGMYMQYAKKMMEVKKLYPTTKVENPTEEQLEQEILAKYNRQRALLDVRLDYYHRLRKVLTPSQIQKIYEDEKARKDNLQQPQGRK